MEDVKQYLKSMDFEGGKKINDLFKLILFKNVYLSVIINVSSKE